MTEQYTVIERGTSIHSSNSATEGLTRNQLGPSRRRGRGSAELLLRVSDALGRAVLVVFMRILLTGPWRALSGGNGREGSTPTWDNRRVSSHGRSTAARRAHV